MQNYNNNTTVGRVFKMNRFNIHIKIVQILVFEIFDYLSMKNRINLKVKAKSILVSKNLILKNLFV